LVVIALIAVLCVPSLAWFGIHWTVIGNDAARYLLAGSQLISGRGLENLNDISEFNGGHGPVMPALLGSLILVFGRDTAELAWAMRLLALLNPLLAYFLVKRISGPLPALIAAALLTLFGFNVMATIPFNIDAALLTFYVLSLLTLLAAINRNSGPLALLSGMLLGLSILTKETALANLPLALLAVLLLDWDLRTALWHYLGVALACLPWWAWAWVASGDVYLIDRLPVPFQLPILIATAIFLLLAAGAYASGMAARFLAGERRRRWTGWFVTLAWTVTLTGMLLATATHALSKVSIGMLRRYLTQLLEPSIIVVPMLLVVLGYVVWKAIQHGGAWRLLALALLFQTPVCLLVTVERWAPRQFLVPQTLVFCALAVLIVDAGGAALRGRGYSARLIGAIAAATLAILLLAASVERVQALLPESPVGGLSGKHRVAVQETRMVDWMARNVPEEEHVLVVSEPAINVAQANYLMFLDGGRHEWTQLQLDQAICQPRPNIQIRCDPEQNAVSRIPPDPAWVQTIGNCRVISLSMPNLLDQARQSNSEYVAISGSYVFPGILQLPAALRKSKAFEIVHTERGRRVAPGVKEGAVLLKSTGRSPKALPTQMNGNTLLRLNRCEQTKGPGYAERLRSNFPQGIMGPNGTLMTPD